MRLLIRHPIPDQQLAGIAGSRSRPEAAGAIKLLLQICRVHASKSSGSSGRLLDCSLRELRDTSAVTGVHCRMCMLLIKEY